MSVRDKNGVVLDDQSWPDASLDVLATAMPWRTFRWRQGQKHYSGIYWSSVQGDHVIYESRLELAVLLLTDFDPRTRGIVSQPFLLKAVVDGRVRRHVPDYLVLTDAGPVVVDVKPLRRLGDAAVAATFDWTRTVVGGRGWRYEVRSEPSSVHLENVRFLAGYRRAQLISPALLAEVRSADLNGCALGEALTCRSSFPPALVRAAVLHLLWTGELTTDLGKRLSRSHVLRATR